MEFSVGETPDGIANNGQRTGSRAFVPDDKVILDLAKRRLTEKRNMIGQILDAVFLFICMLMFVGLYDASDRAILALLAGSFWSIRLLIRFIRFVRPSFKNGVVAYFKERKNRKLEAEYNRLKKMSMDYVLGELNK